MLKNQTSKTMKNKKIGIFILAIVFLPFLLLSQNETSPEEPDQKVEAIAFSQLANAEQVKALQQEMAEMRKEVNALKAQLEQQLQSTAFHTTMLFALIALSMILMALVFLQRGQFSKIRGDNAEQMKKLGHQIGQLESSFSSKEPVPMPLPVESEEDKEHLKALNEEVEEKSRQIEVLQQQLRDSEAVGEPEPSLFTVTDYEWFVTPLRNMIDLGDRLVAQSLESMQTLTDTAHFSKETAVLSGILQKYLQNSEEANQKKWRSILNFLEHGTIVNAHLLRNVSNIKEDRQKIQWLEKPMYIEFLKPFINNTLILMEELRNLKYFLPKEDRVNDEVYQHFATTFKDKIDQFLNALEEELNLKVNYLEMCSALEKDNAKFVDATDAIPISSYYEVIKEIAREQEKTFVIEINSYSTNSKHETKKTIAIV